MSHLETHFLVRLEEQSWVLPERLWELCWWRFSSAGLASTCQGGVGGSVSVGGREMDLFKSLPDLLSMY